MDASVHDLDLLLLDLIQLGDCGSRQDLGGERTLETTACFPVFPDQVFTFIVAGDDEDCVTVDFLGHSGGSERIPCEDGEA